METFFKKISSFLHYFPAVRADSELVDPQEVLRNKCQKTECNNFFEKLNTCNERVRSKKKTSETCDEEMIDFVTCIDNCAAKTLFSKLK